MKLIDGVYIYVLLKVWPMLLCVWIWNCLSCKIMVWYELCYLLTPLLTCVSTVVSMLAWQCLLGAGSLGVWFSALHEVPYFIMMELLFSFALCFVCFF